MKHIWLYMIAVTVVFAACKKEPLPELPEGNDPIYTMSGLVDGDSLNWNVGLESVVLNKGVSEENGVLLYYGEMESITTGEKIRLEFTRQERQKIGTNFNVFRSYNVPFLVHEKGKVEFDFGGVGNEVNNLQIIDSNGNPAKTDNHEIEEFGYHNIRMRFRHYGGHEFSVLVKHGYQDKDLVSDFHAQGDNDLIILEPKGDAEAYSHEWYIDHTLVSTEMAYEGTAQDGIHTIMHRVFDADGNSSFSNGLFRFKGGKEFWSMKINQSPDYEYEAYNYGRVIVSMYKDGEWYSSDHAVSNKGNHLNANNALFIPNEEEGQPLMSFDYNFSVTLHNDTQTDSLELSNLNGKFLLGLE